jgi:hypothetical protein
VRQAGVQRDGTLVFEPELLQSVPDISSRELHPVATNAGGKRGNGLTEGQKATTQQLVASVLRHAQADWTDPAAVRRARDALERPFVMLALTPASPGEASDFAWVTPDVDVAGMVEGLSRGEHLFVVVHLENERQESAHALALSCTRVSADGVRMSIFNPVGWRPTIGEDCPNNAPEMSKMMSLSEAVTGLSALPEGMVEQPSEMGSATLHRWSRAEYGMPLLNWFSHDIAPDSDPDPTELRMPAQKASDCGVEVQFAWLASVLPKADYKLAKSHVLNVLAHTDNSGYRVPKFAVRRLQERATSALSGHAMLTGSE